MNKTRHNEFLSAGRKKSNKQNNYLCRRAVMLAIVEKTPDKIKAVTGFEPIPPPKYRRNHRPTEL